MKRYSDYDPFARVYNKHWGNNFVPLVLPLLDKYILRQLLDNAKILDLCCGTGQLARILSERGYKVTGLDGSTEMLKYTRENAPSAEFILADARSFKLSERFDAVISTFDSLNHIMTLEELSAVFLNVFNTLSDSGIFFFDLNMAAGFGKDWQGDSSIVEEDTLCVIRSDYNPMEQTARFRATIFLNDNGWQRSDFTLTQKCYTEKEIVSALETTGFKDIRGCEFDIQSGLAELTPDADRAFFLCRKVAD